MGSKVFFNQTIQQTHAPPQKKILALEGYKAHHIYFFILFDFFAISPYLHEYEQNVKFWILTL